MSDDDAAIWKRRCLHARAWAAYHSSMDDWESRRLHLFMDQQGVAALKDVPSPGPLPDTPRDLDDPRYGLGEDAGDGWDGFMAEQKEAANDGNTG